MSDLAKRIAKKLSDSIPIREIDYSAMCASGQWEKWIDEELDRDHRLCDKELNEYRKNWGGSREEFLRWKERVDQLEAELLKFQSVLPEWAQRELTKEKD